MNKDEKNDSFDSEEESDEDFCPENEAQGNLSEEDTDDNDSDNEKTTKKCATKRNKKSTEKSPQNSVVNENEKLDEPNDEEDKKRSDSLWASFLSDVNTDSTNSTTTTATTASITKQNTEKIDKTKTKPLMASDKIEISGCETLRNSEPQNKTVKITEILEFAGEEIKVTKELDIDDMKLKLLKNQTKVTDNKMQNNKLPQILKRPPTGGLSSILGQIGKKTKLSVLEKTKMDWQSFKQDKGLNEEIKTHNRGKDGYLERQDFLERTDLKQFEIEKGFRQSKRSNR